MILTFSILLYERSAREYIRIQCVGSWALLQTLDPLICFDSDLVAIQSWA
jgi:hypothetical protein